MIKSEVKFLREKLAIDYILNYDVEEKLMKDWLTPYSRNKFSIETKKLLIYKNKEIICTQDEAVRNLIFLLEGKIRVVNSHHNGKRVEMASITAPYILGEMELLSQSPGYVSSVEACGPVKCVQISKEDYYDCLSNDNKFTNNVLKRMSRMLCQSSRRAAFDLISSNEGVLINYFLRLMEENKNMNEFCLKNHTRVVLSERTGISQRTLNRLLANFQKEGYIKIVSGKVCLIKSQYNNLLARLDKI